MIGSDNFRMESTKPISTLDLPTAIAGALLIFGTAWVYPDGFVDGERFPKWIVVAVVSFVASAIWLAHDRSLGPLSCLDKWVLAFLASTLFAYTGSTAPLVGGIELAKFSMLTTLYFAFSRLASRDHLLLWATCLSLATLVIAIIGISQYFGVAFVGWRTAGLPSATFLYRNFLAMYLIVSLPLSVAAFLLARRLWSELALVLSPTSCLLLLVYTRTRGAWVGLAGSILLLAVCLYIRRRVLPLSETRHLLTPRKLTITAIAIIGVAMCTQVGPILKAARNIDQKIPESKSSASEALMSIAQGQGSGRLIAWHKTLDLIRDHPFGVGLMDWEVMYPPYDQGVQTRPGRAWRRPHNDYLWFAAEYGIPLFLVYIAFLVSAAVTAWRTLHATPDPRTFILLAACVSGFVALYGHAMFSFPRERIGAYAISWFLLAIVSGLSPSPVRSQERARWAAPVAAIVVSAMALGLTFRAALSDHWNWIGYTLFRKGHAELGEPWMEKSIQLGVFDYKYLLRKSQVHQEVDHLEAAIAANQQCLEVHPNSMAAYFNLGILNAHTGDYEASVGYYKALLVLAPDYPLALRDLGIVYLALGRIPEAWEVSKKALEGIPNDHKLNYNVGVLYRQEGNLEKALEHFRIGVDNLPALRERAQVAHELGLSNEAVESLETVVRIDSTSAEDYYPLAAMYENAGRTEDARNAYAHFIALWTEEDRPLQRAKKRLELLTRKLESTKE